MATYFHGNSEIQGTNDGLQTLILMNPAYVNYSDNNNQPPPPPSGNFLFVNPQTPPPSQQPQHFVGIPLQHQHQHQQQQDISQSLHGFFPRAHYNLYNPPIEIAAATREVTPNQQGLSLSLNSQHPPPGFLREVNPSHGDDQQVTGGSPSSASGVSNGVNGVQSHVLLSSKYLKAAQELLDEVVNVGKEVNKIGGESSSKGGNGREKNIGEISAVSTADGGEGSSKSGIELTTAERQEIQMKKAKLVNMLDEVEQRYRQYHHQMQIVISWFEQAAGIGSAKTYTALALQTISKQFRCLKDAILGQIRAASKSLGEEDSLGGKTEGSRLKYVDNQIRQQRALQQLGMIQHNAWRPQRGLPERSVTVLRAWLFEHFLHPYPKDSDKIMLAKQTGLTRSQVSNWFINARVRLWKPMVEEMYMEEMKENERNGNGSEEKTSKSERNEDSSSKSTAPQAKSPGTEHHNMNFITKQDNLVNQNVPGAIPMSTNSTSLTGANMRSIEGFNLIGSSEMEGIIQGSPKKPRSADMLNSPISIQSMNMDSKPTNVENDLVSMKFGNERQSSNGFTLMGAPTNFTGGFGSFQMELGRFGAEQFQAPYSGNGVSLTLGLPHGENLSMAGSHQTFLPNQSIQLGRGLEIGETNDFNGMNTPTSSHSTNMYESLNTPTSAHSSNVYENMNIQNRKRFAAQLLRDFVA